MPKKPAKRSKSPKSSGKPSAQLIPQPHGGALLPGAGGGPQPGAGRPKDAFKALCREMASGEKTIASLQKIVENPDHPQFMAAIRYLTEHGYGKPVESVEVTGKDGGPVEVRQQIIIGGVAIVF